MQLLTAAVDTGVDHGDRAELSYPTGVAQSPYSG